MKKYMLFLFLLGFTAQVALAQSAGRPDTAWRPAWQVETTLNRNSANYFYGIAILYTDREELADQTERSAFYVAVTRLEPVASRLAVRYGFSLADRGYREDRLLIDASGFHRSHGNINLVYLGTPVSIAFNLTDNRRFVSGFVEAGILPELLLFHDSSEYMNFDLRSLAWSGQVKTGVKLNFRDGYSIVAGPGVQVAMAPYDKNSRPNDVRAHPDGGFLLRDYRPIAVNLSVGVQF